ncbi:hypothetical protein EIP86_003171 [Pleurotus ostreatoroseus]|nr:hypothetical protein EIP86_003171 [Pleurotus ostreatoroseus]
MSQELDQYAVCHGRAYLEHMKAEYIQQMAEREVEYKRAQVQLQEEYRRDLRALKAQIQRVHGEMNSLAPIARLPPELLSAIFIIFNNDFWDKLKSSAHGDYIGFGYWDEEDDETDERPRAVSPPREDTYTGTRYGPCALEDISGRRRTIYPWQTLQCVSPNTREIVDFAVKNSRTLPLDIVWLSSYLDDGLDTALSNLSRAKSLMLAITPWVRNRINFLGAGAIDAPQLTSIDCWLHEVPRRCTLKPLEKLRAPKLASLETFGGSPSLIKSLFRSTLTSLTMRNWIGRDWGLLTTILGSLPGLQTLSLRFSRRGPYTFTPAKGIAFPKLTSLVIYDRTMSEGIAQFLNHIDCPALVDIKCWYDRDDTDQRYSNKLDDALRKALKNKMNSTALATSFLPRTIAFDGPSDFEEEDGDHHFHIGFWTSEQDSLDYRKEWVPENGSFLDLRFLTAQDSFTKALPMFNLAHVTTVWIKGCVRTVPLPGWRKIFHSMPNLYTLHIGGVEFRDLAAMLKVPQPDSTKPLVLPLMKVLDLRPSRQNFTRGPTEMLERLELSMHPRRTALTQDETQFLMDANIAKVVHIAFTMDHRPTYTSGQQEITPDLTRLEQTKKDILQQIAEREAAHRRARVHFEEQHAKEMYALWSQVSGLSGEMNSLAPISRLPTEILRDIFLIFSNEFWGKFASTTDDPDLWSPFITHDYSHNERRRPTAYPWQTLQCVCTQWYYIVQQTRSLFTCIAPDTRGTVDFLIRKSGTLPLDIFWNSCRHEESDGLDRALLQLSRISSLFLVLSSETAEGLGPMLTEMLVAPQLTRMHYEFTSSCEESSVSILSKLHTPNLTSLKTNGGSLNILETLLRPTLTSLYLSNWYRRDWGRMTTLLRSLKNLHTLSLRLSQDSIHALTVGEHIEFPRLTSLDLFDGSYCQGIALFLDHVSCPILATLKCSTGLDRQESRALDTDLRRAFKNKMETTRLASSFLPRTIALHADWQWDDTYDNNRFTYILLGVWSSEQNEHTLYCPPRWGPEEGSFFGARLESVKNVLGKVLPLFNLVHVTSVWINGCTEGSAPLWRRFFCSTPNVHTLYVRSIKDLADALRAPKQDSTSPLILPLLKTLKLMGVAKRDLQELERLVSALQSRQRLLQGDAGTLDSLEFSASYLVGDALTQNDIQFLKDANVAKMICI